MPTLIPSPTVAVTVPQVAAMPTVVAATTVIAIPTATMIPTPTRVPPAPTSTPTLEPTSVQTTQIPIIYSGEGEGRLINEIKNILDRVWNKEGDGRDLRITFTYTPIYNADNDRFLLLEWAEPNKATIVIPREPSEVSNGVLYAVAFVTSVMAIAEDPQHTSEETFRTIYDYATDYEVQEIWDDCGQLEEMIYCDLFIAYSSRSIP